MSRVFIAASSLGTAEPSLELSLQHAASRVTFGRPIGHRQAVQRYLAYDTRRHPVERLYRDAPLTWLEEDTPTIQYMVAPRELLAGYTFDDAFDSASDAAVG